MVNTATIDTVAWEVTAGLTDYRAAVASMEARAQAITEGRARERLWLVEHPPLYTGGTSAREHDLRNPRFPVIASSRGGQYTYHGPGQRVVYVQLHLVRRGVDVRSFVRALETWVIDALADFGVTGERRCGRTGVWVARGAGQEAKIAALGLRVRRGVSLHGLAINVVPDLSHYAGIIPCGISDHGVTSLVDLGVQSSMADVDAALMAHLPRMLASLLPQAVVANPPSQAITEPQTKLEALEAR